MKEMAIPALPMINVRKTRAFFEALGFTCVHEQEPPDTFLIMMMRTIQLHFFEYSGVNPDANFASTTIMTPHLDELHAHCAKAGVAKVLPIEHKPWGTREFAFFDPAGNLIRFQEQFFDI